MPSETAGRVPWKAVTISYLALRYGGVPDEAYSGEVLEAVRAAAKDHAFVSWELLLDLADQARTWCADDERFIEACDGFDESTLEVRAFITPGVDTRRFFRFVLSIFDVQILPGVALSVREIGDNAMEVEIRVPPGSRDATSWFLGNVGAFRTIPRHLGLPPAKVDADIGTHRARYRVRFPATRGQVDLSEAERLEAMESLSAWVSDGMRMGFRTPEAVTPGRRREQRAGEWGLTQRQREVLARIQRGLSNRQIAEELQCATKRVELHVTAILQKSKCATRAQLLASFLE